RKQRQWLADNCRREGIPLPHIGSRRQGIVHVIGPELGLTQPGMLIVCGDSHTSTHGAFGSLAFGIGTSEVEVVLATQCLPQKRQGDLAVTVSGELPIGVTAKDIVLSLIGRTGTSAGQGHLVEYRGRTPPGARRRPRSSRAPAVFPPRAARPTSAPSATWTCGLESRSRTSRSTVSSSARAPTPDSKTCARPPA